jgi:DNA-binding Xre family transcriptional regulator
MAIVVKLDDLLHERRYDADRARGSGFGMALANVSILKTGKSCAAIRFSTLEAILRGRSRARPGLTQSSV